MPVRSPLQVLASCLLPTVPVLAVELPGFEFGGYVDAVFAAVDGDAAVADDAARVDSSASAQLEVDVEVDPAAALRLELFYEQAGGVSLQEAMIAWSPTPALTLLAGRFENWLGWEGADAPERYRVNNAFINGGDSLGGNGDPVGIFGVDSTGLALLVQATGHWELGLFLVDHIYLDPADRPQDRLSVGGSLAWSLEEAGFGAFDLMLGVDEAGGGDDILGFDLWHEFDVLREPHGWLFALDLNYTDYQRDAVGAVLVMANHRLPTTLPLSVSLMLDWIDPALDADDDAGLELALALLANPSGDDRFACRAEARLITREAADSNEYGLFLEALAVLP